MQSFLIWLLASAVSIVTAVASYVAMMIWVFPGPNVGNLPFPPDQIAFYCAQIALIASTVRSDTTSVAFNALRSTLLAGASCCALTLHGLTGGEYLVMLGMTATFYAGMFSDRLLHKLVLTA